MVIESTQYAFLVCVWNAESATLFHHIIGLASRQCLGQHTYGYTYIWMDVNDTLHNTQYTIYMCIHTAVQSHDTMKVAPCHVDTHTYQAASRRKPLPLPLPGSQESLCTNVWPTQLNMMMWRRYE